MQNFSLHKSILKTLAYADIFDSPLTLHQLWQFLISERRVDKNVVERSIATILTIEKINDYFCFRGRAHIVDKKIATIADSSEKYRRAAKASLFLSRIPTVVLIGVSGGLAVGNVSKDDDIDLFIIAQKGTLWMTRFFSNLLLDALRMRRKRGARDISGKICLNMFIEERGIAIPKNKQNLYTAHEIAQMILLFERNNTYQRFLQANTWVEKFLPNSIDIKKKLPILISEYLSIFLSSFEFLAKKVQLWYMKKHRTREEINDYILAFYPFDYEKKLLKKYEERLKKYHIA
ncbi:MAG: hypothetical protein HYV39_03890 [Candidatus Levybacteria bacterium]|nr:hypothetical protein [Candidatus Levybacteria bacterium]